MDGSFLSDKEVIAAARRFVCIRLATYEHAEEGAFMKTIFSGPTKQLENSVFAILAPDGKEQLTRTGRSPSFAFGEGARGIKRMAKTMTRVSKRFPGKAKTRGETPAPSYESVRLAINVASCDSRPLVLAFEPDSKKQATRRTQLQELAWHPVTRGR